MPKAKANASKPSSDFALKEAPSSDAALVQACVAGEQAAWRELVRRYAGLVYSVPMRLGLDEESSEDVFQMVFEALLRQLPKLREPRTLPKWLLTAARRISWKLIQQSKRPLAEPATAEQVAPSEELMQWERRTLVQQALERLGGRCQELLTTLYLGQSQPSYELVAQQLGLPLGSIGPTRARCMEKLMRLLQDVLEE